MSEPASTNVRITVDLKKYRIRLHKSTLHLLGDPPYVQLLINPTAGVVAVKALSRNASGDSTHRISRKQLLSSNSVEIYSMSFIEKLMHVVPGLQPGHRYRMTGEVVPAEKLAFYSFETLKELSECES
ncbi:MAG: hypothetical protein IJK38_00045 [Oscillospiraceae bacterium]|nr:hypothetical protein [Oscillospiraceae bacterium]